MVSESSISGSDLRRVGGSGETHVRRAWLLRAVQKELTANANSAASTDSASSRQADSGHAPSTERSADTLAYRANGLEAINRHLDRFVAAARREGVPQAAQVLQGICAGCAGCPQSSMVCPLCMAGTCIVLRDADTILHAIANALWVARDPEYLQNHPSGP